MPWLLDLEWAAAGVRRAELDWHLRVVFGSAQREAAFANTQLRGQQSKE